MAVAKQLFFNLPSTNLAASEAFITALGFAKKSEWCMGEQSLVFAINDSGMLFYHDTALYKQWLPEKMPIADAKSSNACIISFSVESKEKVDELISAAIAAGGSKGPNMLEQMGAEVAEKAYSRSVFDQDGHLFEIVWSNNCGDAK